MRRATLLLLVGVLALMVLVVPAGADQVTETNATVANADQSGVNESLSLPGRGWASASGVGATSNGISGQFAIEFWLRYNESSDTDAVVMTKGGIPGQRSGNYVAYLNGDGDARQITFSFNSFAGSITSNSEIAAGQWTHVAMTYDGSTQTLYLNGQQDAQHSESDSPDTTDHALHFGVDDAESGHFLDGRIDNVRIWSDSRNLIEIEDNVYPELAGTESGLQALWQFDGNTNDMVGGSDLSLAGDANRVQPDSHLIPPKLYATPVNDHVRLNWTEQTGPQGENSADSFEIYRSTSPSFSSTSGQLIATVSGSSESYVDTGVSAGNTYYYQIRSVDADGNAGGFSKATVARAYVERGGGSLDFDGRGYGVAGDRPSLDVSGNFAMEFWLKYNASSDKDAVVLTKGGIPGGPSGNYLAYLNGDGEGRRITFSFNSGAGSITSSTEIQARQWTHVAVTYDGNTQTLYLNGQQDAQDSQGDSPGGTGDDFHVGVDDSEGGHFLNGSVDDVRVWTDNRARSEIQQNYRNRLVGNEAGLENYWRFNELGLTSNATSSESKKNNLTLEGDAAIEAGGAYPVAPYVFATSENAASNVTFENRLDQPLDSVHYQFTTGDAPTAGAGTELQPSAFNPRDVAGLTNGITYEHYLQSEFDGQRSDFQRAATATPYADRGGSSLTVGSQSYGTASDRPTLDVSGEFTLEFWVKYDASSDTDAVVLSKGGIPGSDSGNYQAYLRGDGEDRQVQFTFNGFHSDIRSNGGIPAEVWTHVAYTWDGSTQEIYINGELDRQGNEDDSPGGVSQPLRFGTDQPATAHYLEGHLDEVALWNYSRTDQEIQDSYTTGFLGNESGLEHYWRFDESDRTSSTGSATWHATVETRDGATLEAPGVMPVPPRTFARGEIGRTEVAWRVRNRPDDVYVYASEKRDRSDRQLSFQADANQQSIFEDRQVTNNQTMFYETTSLTVDGQESDYSFPASAYPSGQVAGNAWSFNGDSSHVTVEDRPALDISSPFSIEFWVKYNASSDADAVVASKGGIPGSDSGNYMAYLLGSGNQRPVQFTFNGFHSDLKSSTAINASEWTHVAYTWDGSNQEIYINGELDTQGSDDDSPSGVSQPLRVGTDQAATGHYLNGTVDDLRISHEPRRTPTEIQETYDRELVGDENGLEGYWRGCYSIDTQDVWGHARKPMTAAFNNVECTPSTIGLENESLTTRFNVTLEPNNGLSSYLISVETAEDTAIRSLQPDLLNGSDFWVYDGGPGEANVTASGSDTTGITASNESRTLITLKYSGNVTRDDLTLDVIELTDDAANPLPESAVNLTKVGGTGTESDAPTGPKQTELSLTPANTSIGSGSAATFHIDVTNASGGVGNYNVSVATNNSNAQITSVSNQISSGKLGFIKSTKSIGANNRSAMLHYVGGNTSDTGTVTLATITVSGNALGTTRLGLSFDELTNESGSPYTVTAANDATVTVSQSQAPTVVGNTPAKDLDGDGRYEDINGDKQFDLNDVIGFLSNYRSSTIQNQHALFNFNGQGGVDLNDVLAMLSMT